jgi:replicative DNA helicase
MAIDMQIPTLVFSMEMSRDQLLHRIAFGGFGIATNKARTGMLSREDQQAFGTGIAKIRDTPLWIDETSDLSTADLRARVDLMVRLHGIKLVFIDYLQMVDPVTKIGKSEERLGIKETCKTVHHLKKKHKLIIIAAAQLNQNIEKAPGRRHVLSDIEGSDAIGKYSDFVGFITRPSEVRRWAHLDQKRQEKQINAWHQARRDNPEGYNGWRSRDVAHPLHPQGHVADADDDPDAWFDKKPKHQGKTTTTRKLASDLDGDPETTSVHETSSITMPDGTTWTFDNEKDWDQTAEIQLVKNRNGPTPDLPVRFNRELARFESRTAKVYSNNMAERQH